jgi:hypothetical protein
MMKNRLSGAARAMHPGLAGYMTGNAIGMPEARHDGALVLVIDGLYRIFFRPAQHGDLVMEARLVDVPESTAARERMLTEVLEAAADRLLEHADMPTLSSNEDQLTLQQRIPQDAGPAEVEVALEQFTNAVVAWRSFLGVL